MKNILLSIICVITHFRVFSKNLPFYPYKNKKKKSLQHSKSMLRGFRYIEKNQARALDEIQSLIIPHCTQD
jgi:hypothetical protein